MEYEEYEALTVEECLEAIQDGTVELSHLLRLAGTDQGRQIVSPSVIAAISARMELESDIYNGGLDQAVWNHGADAARGFGEVLCAVGAIENGEVLLALAEAVAPFRAACGGPGNAVEHFAKFRAEVGGPEFRIPDLDEELAEALVEYVLEREALG